MQVYKNISFFLKFLGHHPSVSGIEVRGLFPATVQRRKNINAPLILARRCPMNSEGIRRRWKWIDAFFVREGYRYEKNSAIGKGEGESLMSPMRILNPENFSKAGCDLK